MKDLLLSPHFKLSDFERSATATSTGSTSLAARTRARTATRSSTSCRRSNPQWFQLKLSLLSSQPSLPKSGRAFFIAIAILSALLD